MKSIKAMMVFLLAVLVMFACNKVSHKKTPGGMPYQLFRGKGTVKAKNGQILKIHLTQKIKDSVYFDTRGKIAYYMPITGQVNPYDLSEIWTELRKGDSIITTQMMDTFIKRNRENVPKEFNLGDRIVTTVKVLDIFPTDSLARLDEENERKAVLAEEVSFLEKYLADKKINVQKTPSGAFVEVIKPGDGNMIDSGNVVSVNYTGVSFSGKKFDSNVDTAFRHVEPMSFPVGMGQMIKGFDEAMRFLSLNAEAKVYIPSMLAYGPRPMSPDIKPYEHLIFDIKVVGVKESAPNVDPMSRQNQKVDVPQRK